MYTQNKLKTNWLAPCLSSI